MPFHSPAAPTRRPCFCAAAWTRSRTLIWIASAILVSPPAALAGETPPASRNDPAAAAALRQAFEAAWARQPEAAALGAQRDAAQAELRAAQSWTPEPPALELSGKTDRFQREAGAREYNAGLAIPLWLPGERERSRSLAEAGGRAVESQRQAAQLRVAARVREAWWQARRAQAEVDAAQDQATQAGRLADDVRRRVGAGDLARADQHQADGAQAAAEANLAQARAGAVAARQHLLALTAWSTSMLDAALAATPEDTEPEPAAAAAEPEAHGELQALRDRATVAEQQAALAAAQTRANPELTISTTRERGAFGEPWAQSLTVAVRLPFGAGPRHDARRAAARAEALSLQTQWQLERARIASEGQAAQARTAAARVQLDAALRRARLADESRQFFDQSFRLGESDLPTRLRIEAEAVEAQRQAGRARIELAAAVSAWRQALGLLPP